MNLKISVLLFLLISFSCKKANIKEHNSVKNKYLIESNELKSILNNEHIKIVDFRKKVFYKQKHIAGALQMWRTDIEDTSYAYKGMMANQKQIETLFW